MSGQVVGRNNLLASSVLPAVSALIADGPPSRVVHEAVAGRFILMLPAVVVEELGRVLTSKLGFAVARWREVEEFLVDLAHEIPAAPADVPAVSGDRADDAVLASALAAGATLVVTGDRRHLLPLGTHAGIRLLTPQAFLAELRAGAD